MNWFFELDCLFVGIWLVALLIGILIEYCPPFRNLIDRVLQFLALGHGTSPDAIRRNRRQRKTEQD
jgi:hypothetical protein